MRLLIISLSLICALGCSADGPALFPVTGSVRFADGTPLRTGTVEFESAVGGLNARGSIDHQGNFRLHSPDGRDGAVAGKHRAVVLQTFVAEHLPAQLADHGPHTARRFAKYETSGLEFEVTPTASNEFTIVVERAD